MDFEASYKKLTSDTLALGALPPSASSLQQCNDLFRGLGKQRVARTHSDIYRWLTCVLSDTLEHTLLDIETRTVGLAEVAQGHLPKLSAFLNALLSLFRGHLSTLDNVHSAIEATKINIRAQLHLEVICSR